MRESLIKLIKHVTSCEKCFDEDIADYLIANGVIVPPCKVGDMLYLPINRKIIEYKVLSWCVREWGVHITTHSMQTGGLHPVRGDCIGKTVFLTREEAEKALKERENFDRG